MVQKTPKAVVNYCESEMVNWWSQGKRKSESKDRNSSWQTDSWIQVWEWEPRCFTILPLCSIHEQAFKKYTQTVYPRVRRFACEKREHRWDHLSQHLLLEESIPEGGCLLSLLITRSEKAKFQNADNWDHHHINQFQDKCWWLQTHISLCWGFNSL